VLKFIVIGLFQGATYGLLAVGLVLVYKGARVFNFAQGEFGTVGAYMAFVAFEQLHLPYGLAVVGGLAAAVLLGLAVERVVVRPLFDSPRITLLVATVGVALFLIAAEVIIAVAQPRVLRGMFTTNKVVVILGAGLRMQQVVVLLVLIALAPLLALFFSKTDLGLAVLAASQDATATRIVGISTSRMSQFTWGFAALLGALAGILQAPITIFYPGFMTIETLIPAFTAAVLGGMTSLPGAFVAGELVGVAQVLGGAYLGDHIPGAPDLTVFVLLLLVLLVRPQGLLGKET
jgi:branched-chain amino acid transport system permease protein